MLSKNLAARQCVRLQSSLSRFVSLLVGHCVRLVSLLSLSPVLSPFLPPLVIVSVLSPFCFLSPNRILLVALIAF